MLRIAIQSRGRLSQARIALLDAVGVKLTIRDQHPVLVRSSNFPAEVLFFEKDRVPEFVASGVADIGITGEYMALSKNISEESMVKRLGFDRCNLSLAVPCEVKYKGLEWFIGKRVATPYPDALTKFFKQRNIRALVIPVREQVTMAPKIGLADAIFDRVFSGTTLFSQHLKEVEMVMHSEAVLIANANLTPQKLMILDELLLRIDAVQNAMGKKYLMMNVPTEKISDLLEVIPALQKPTIMPLTDPEWQAVHVVIDEKRFWDIIEKLKQLGAVNLLLSPIEKLID